MTKLLQRPRTAWLISAVVASALLFGSILLPLWRLELIAPQYPTGLVMRAYGYKFAEDPGTYYDDVREINGLNHYIGMKQISADMFPEFAYMKYILAGFIAYGLLVAVIGKRGFLLSLLVLTLALAGAALYDFYQWGYDYGHNLDPNAAIKVPGFSYQPPVIGHKTLLNFDAYSYPDTGGWIITIAGLIFFGVYFYEVFKNRGQDAAKKKTKTTVSPAKAVLAVSALVVLASCDVKPEPFAYGKDLCEDCKMTIMEPNFGAEIITKKGRIFKFDDVHCVVNYLRSGKINSADIKQTLFIEYNNGASFVEAEKAQFVSSPKLKSPMNSNTAAFASAEAAQKMAAETGGTVKDWAAVQQQ